MNQQCKVCGEPAAGFHFGAFTCEGCKSFFGRSYNNLSSISECKNNGECIINKKNRTACKACRLRKCVLVGMSKSGSRYGRRSNWFKIHCLLQEQQQVQAAAQQNGLQKGPPLSPNSLNLMQHPSYSSNLFSRPAYSQEELMMLRLDEYAKHPAAASSPSISSPDSHNSDSSIEIGDKRNTLLGKHKRHTPTVPQLQLQPQSPLSLNKDLFLPMPFSGFPLMPPPGFLPSTHFLFSSYHNALFEQNHHLLQQQIQQSSSLILNEHKNCDNSEDDGDSERRYEKRSKMNFSQVLVEPKKEHTMVANSLMPRSRSPQIDIKNSDEDEEIDLDDNDDVLTPPRSPKSPSKVHLENNPIDLSTKSGSTKSGSTKSEDINHNHCKTLSKNRSDALAYSDCDLSNQKFQPKTGIDHDEKYFDSINRNNSHGAYDKSQRSKDEVEAYDREFEFKRLRKSHSSPLDLTTKI